MKFIKTCKKEEISAQKSLLPNLLSNEKGCKTLLKEEGVFFTVNLGIIPCIIKEDRFYNESLRIKAQMALRC